jgi:hypothetical protein
VPERRKIQFRGVTGSQRLDAANMKKQVSVDQLKFGVYVNELDRPWTDTPFMYQGFVINSGAQLKALKKYCKRTLPKGSIEIDPAEYFI